jgi:CBS domain containing-hemolysin-like protein
MTPRPEMVAVPVDTTVEQFIELLGLRRFSRVPVYEGSLDRIKGIVFAHDVLQVPDSEAHTRTVASLMHTDVYFVPESKRTSELLREMQKNNIRMAIVVDEYGGVAGLVTIEDLVEEIVGDIQDEYDHEEKLYEKISDDEYIVDAKISIHDFNEMLDMKLDDSDYDTLGGFVYAQLDKIPNTGDTITFEGVTFTVMAKRGRRITKVHVARQQEVSSEEEPQEAREVLLLPPPQDRKKPGNSDAHERDRGEGPSTMNTGEHKNGSAIA